MEHITRSGMRRNGHRAVLGLAAAALLLLSGCGQDDGGDSPATTAEPTMDSASGAATEGASEGAESQEPTASGYGTPSGSASGAGSASPTASGSGMESGSGGESGQGTAGGAGRDDPAFAAIDAALAGRSGATVVSVNRDDGGMVYEIEMAEGENIVEVETAGEGEVRETGTDSDGDDLANAREASVSAADAIETALDGRSDRVLDEAELDRHDGRLVWAIDLDDAQGMDAGEVHVDAGTGEVMTS